MSSEENRPYTVNDHYLVNQEGCWIWQRCISADGYSRCWDKKLKKADLGHRVYYRLYKGDIPEGLVLDHLCRVKFCVNPDHLEAVTQRINLERAPGSNALKTHCPKGHEYNIENSYFYNREGKRQRACRVCQLERARIKTREV